MGTRDAYSYYGRRLIRKALHTGGRHGVAQGTVKEAMSVSSALDTLFESGHLPTSKVSEGSKDPEFVVGILGAGIGGLYAALILNSLDIKYEIIEATGRSGGRLYTHKFKKQDGSPGDEYDYYDVGAMRFPDNEVMRRLFHLFNYKPLNTGEFQLHAKLREYHFDDLKNNNLLYFNDTRRKRGGTSGDDFQWSDLGVGEEYLKVGVTQIMNDAFRPFVDALEKDMVDGGSDGWNLLMEVDAYSTRGYLSTKYIPSPNLGIPRKPLATSIVNWCETFSNSTSSFDRAWAESILEELCFTAPQWKLIDGGAEGLADLLVKYLETRGNGSIALNSRVTGAALNADHSLVEVSIEGKPPKSYPHVISTLPLPCLRTIDLTQCKLNHRQTNALRQLTYGPSIKVGIKFRTAWWSTMKDKDGNPLDIVGGQSATDRPSRTIVYPSQGLPKTPSTVLIASYCWTSDAERLGALIDTRAEGYDNQLKELVLRDLAVVHNLDISVLEGEFENMHAWDWSQSRWTMGAFAFYGPGMFSEAYESLTVPAGQGRLHFAGEALSVRHAAWRAVKEAVVLTFGDASSQYEDFHRVWGYNEEWVEKDADIEPLQSAVFGAAEGTDEEAISPHTASPKKDLLLQHLARDARKLFVSEH
ncbi:FAD/NAD(P)-binding domain superfamily protein [Pleurotus pulmonarius]